MGMIRVLVGLLVSTMLVGCGDTVRYKIIPVTGSLTLSNSQPAPEGTILLFRPSEGKVQSAKAICDNKGNFVVKHTSGKLGCEEGKYSVVIQPPDGYKSKFWGTIVSNYYGEEGFYCDVRSGMGPIVFQVVKGN